MLFRLATSESLEAAVSALPVGEAGGRPSESGLKHGSSSKARCTKLTPSSSLKVGRSWWWRPSPVRSAPLRRAPVHGVWADPPGGWEGVALAGRRSGHHLRRARRDNHLAGCGVSMAIPPAENSVVGSVDLQAIGKTTWHQQHDARARRCLGTAVIVAVFAGRRWLRLGRRVQRRVLRRFGMWAALLLTGEFVGLGLPGWRKTDRSAVSSVPAPVTHNRVWTCRQLVRAPGDLKTPTERRWFLSASLDRPSLWRAKPFTSCFRPAWYWRSWAGAASPWTRRNRYRVTITSRFATVRTRVYGAGAFSSSGVRMAVAYLPW